MIKKINEFPLVIVALGIIAILCVAEAMSRIAEWFRRTAK